MKAEKYLLDLEGNLYSFNDPAILKEYILSPAEIEKEISSQEVRPCEPALIILYDDENIYEMPEGLARDYVMGQRNLCTLLTEISELSFQNIPPEETENLAPAVYKLCETELLFLCEEEENKDVKLYAITAVNNNHAKPQTKSVALKSANQNKSNVKEVKNSLSPCRVDNFNGKTKEEHKNDAFFSSIKNLAKGWAGSNYNNLKSGGVWGGGSSAGGGGGGGGWGDGEISTASKVAEGGEKVFDGLSETTDTLKDIRSDKASNVAKGNLWTDLHHFEDSTSRSLGNLTNEDYKDLSTTFDIASFSLDAASKGLDDGKFSEQDKIDIASSGAGIVADKLTDIDGMSGIAKGLTSLALSDNSKPDDAKTFKGKVDAVADIIGGVATPLLGLTAGKVIADLLKPEIASG